MKHDCQIGDNKVWRKGVFLNGQRKKKKKKKNKPMSHVKVYQRVTQEEEEDINNQVDNDSLW